MVKRTTPVDEDRIKAVLRRHFEFAFRGQLLEDVVDEITEDIIDALERDHE